MTPVPKVFVVAAAGLGAMLLGGPGGLGPLAVAVGAALVIEACFGALVLGAHRRGGVWRSFAVRRAMAMTVFGLALMGAALAAGSGVHQGPRPGATATPAGTATPVPAAP